METTKLDRKLSPANVWALAFGCIIGWGAFVMPGNTFLPEAGSLISSAALFVASLLMIIIAFNYSYMIRVYPLSGGEFTFASNSFGIKHGYFCAWFLALSYASLVPMNATALALIGRTFFDSLFQFGFHYEIYGYEIYLGELILAFFAIIIFGIISIRGVKITGILQFILTIMLISGITVIFVAACIKGYINLDNIRPFCNPEHSEFGGFISVLSVAPFAFVGFDTVPQAAEEYGFSEKKSKIIMIISILFGAAMYIMLIIIASAVHPGYVTWYEYISDVQDLSGIVTFPVFNAAYCILGKFGLFFIGLSVTGAILSGILGFYMATSRLLYSMARNNVIPEWFGELHPVYKTPRNAVLFHMCISLTAPFAGRVVLGWLVDMSSLGAAIGYGYTSAAALRMGISSGNNSIKISGFIGVLSSILFAVILLVPLPGISCSLGKHSYILLIAWLILGLFFFLKSEGKSDKKSGN